ncbi:MAG TPA: hypothetical protein PK971_11945, partial [Saprospiraceae bacterium]|nr:hypothetical protein [Saprospiraceae bacterium]
MRETFRHGFSVGLRLWRLAGLVYLIQLGLALVLGMQVYSVLHKSIGHSVEISHLVRQYDHTVFADFLKAHGASVTPLIGQLRWLLPLWWVCAVFLNGGLLACALRPQSRPDMPGFWAAAATHFLPFLQLGAMFLALMAAWSALVLLPVLLSLRGWVEALPDERYAVGGLLAALALWACGLLVLYVWSVLSRAEQLRQPGVAALSHLRAGWLRYRQNPFRLLGLVLGFLLLQVAGWGLYWSAESLGGMTSALLTGAFFALQQALAYSRVLLRVMT